MNKIKNIIFDLGAVILNIDFNACEREFRKLGIKDFAEIYSRAKQVNLFDKLEEGRISPEEFRNGIRSIVEIPLSEDEIDFAWNSMLLDFPSERIRFLENIKDKYRIFLLSNTNKIHYDKYCSDFRKQYEYEFSELFEKEYYSFKVGFRKPSKEIFQLALNENNLEPSETLFIDDTQMHIDAAKLLGINTIRLNDGEEIYKIIENS